MNWYNKIRNYIKDFSKRTLYFIKLILLIIGTIGPIILIFLTHLNSYILLNINWLELIVRTILDSSILLIPIILMLSSVRRNFKEDLRKLYSLKEELIMLRYEISEEILNKNPQKLIATPITIKDIKESLRYFGVEIEANYIHFLIKDKILWHIDNIIIKILELTKKYDGGTEYERTIREIMSYKKEMEKQVKKYDFKKKWNKKFVENLAYVIAYELYFKKETGIPVSLYYENGLITEKDSQY